MIDTKSKFKIAIIDYNLSNLFSINNALSSLNFNTIITNSKKDILSSDLIVLPGVGAFNKAISNLKKTKTFDLLRSLHAHNKPIISICLGMQMLFESSEEFCKTSGLSIIKGDVHSFKKYKHSSIVPHIGWNDLLINDQNISIKKFSRLKKHIFNKKFYFIHSFFVKPKYKKDILTYTKYDDVVFCSSILKNNLLACQFHPEKSGNNGLKLIDSFIKSIN